MKREFHIGHDSKGNEVHVTFIIPEKLDRSIGMISTVWNDKKRKGETTQTEIPIKSVWDLYDNPIQKKKRHLTKTGALAYHRKEARRWKS